MIYELLEKIVFDIEVLFFFFGIVREDFGNEGENNYMIIILIY